MNFNKISGRVADIYLAEPYSQIQAIKRCTKVLFGCKEVGLPILVLGSKNKFHFNNPALLSSVEHVGTQVTPQFLMQATGKYSLILCLDPILYLPVLRGVSIPLMLVATAKEIEDHSEILTITDYILPQAGGRIDAAVEHLLLQTTKSSGKLILEIPRNTYPMELFTYPSKNYSKIAFDVPDQNLDMATVRNQWTSFGLIRSVHLVLLSHENSFPHVLLIKSIHNGQASWRLPNGYVDSGATDIEGANCALQSLLLKSENSDACVWTIGDVIAQFWRPEFDDYIFPYLPPHVSRPKECLKVLVVTLPPRCVIKLSNNTSMEFVPLSDILRGGIDEYNEIIRSLPTLLSRFAVKSLARE